MRVGPYGVLSLDDRLEEAHKRYEGKPHTVSQDQFHVLVKALKNIEKDIVDRLTILPTDINDESVKSEIEVLRKYICIL